MLITMTGDEGWTGLGWQAWTDLDRVRARLDAGADPNAVLLWPGPPLHVAAEHGSAAAVAELAGRVDDVDALADGRTALWRAVAANRQDNATALIAAGADPSTGTRLLALNRQPSRWVIRLIERADSAA